jgi:hypothetical protein
MPSKVEKHTHKFKRFSATKHSKGNPPEEIFYWRCILPDCYARFSRDIVKGKRTVCAKEGCNNFTIMDKINLKRACPLCLEHSNTKKDLELKQTKTATADIMKDLLG